MFDEHGRSLGAGTTARILVRGTNGREAVTYADREVAIVDGAYMFERVPAPADTRIEIRLPSGRTRTRLTGHGEMQIKWGCCEPNDWYKSYGKPLRYDFGGPGEADDPYAPAFFVSERMEDPEVAWTTVSGMVYHQEGNLVPDGARAHVQIGSLGLSGAAPFAVRAEVIGGAVSERVPTGVLTLDLRVGDGTHTLMHPRPPRMVLPESLTGKPNVINFGGPPTADDQEGPRYAFPSPRPVLTGPSPCAPCP